MNYTYLLQIAAQFYHYSILCKLPFKKKLQYDTLLQVKCNKSMPNKRNAGVNRK